MMRTHRAGDLRAEHVGTAVVVCGWVAHRRDHGGVVFLDVRDTAGLVQVVIDIVGGVAGVTLLNELRAAGFSADRAYGSRSAKKQWGAADRAGARWGMMLGPRELAEGIVTVKDLASGKQEPVPRAEVSAWLRMRKDTSA